MCRCNDCWRLEGWLQKQGHLWKSWLRRYFKQTGEPGGDLVYYETDALSKEKGRICLRTATLLPCSDKPLMFGVKEAGGKTYLLRAPSPEDAERWLRALGGDRHGRGLVEADGLHEEDALLQPRGRRRHRRRVAELRDRRPRGGAPPPRRRRR